jgi:hypothetical protein
MSAAFIWAKAFRCDVWALIIQIRLHRHSREGGERSDRKVNPTSSCTETRNDGCEILTAQVMDSRLRGGDETG